MLRVVKRSAAGPIKTSAPRGRQDAPLPRWIPPQLCQLRPQWLHEIKLDGFRMSGRIERGRVQLLTRTGLDWSDKYPTVIAALAKVRAKTSYLDGELCGIGDDGLPSRHCPKCQAAASRRWLADREAELLPAPYFHVVYTLPSKLRDIAYQNKRVVYDLLMKAAAETTLAIARLVVVELEPWNIRDQGFQKRFALDERQASGVAAVKVQKIEDVVDDPHPAQAIARGLGL